MLAGHGITYGLEEWGGCKGKIYTVGTGCNGCVWGKDGGYVGQGGTMRRDI